ncbi:hypothetical protein J4207_03595 [Candidatus Woesearchaeota archaeon]|nr:hypothetical protein [Candidatus Woesearchaeota archaeon]
MWIINIIDKSKRQIHLSHEHWKHIHKHPESGEYFLERVKETLRKPDKIIQFEFDVQVHFYFRYYKDRREYLFISVKYLNGMDL